MRISDWSSDVCSSDLGLSFPGGHLRIQLKQLFQSFGIVLKSTADIDALQHLVIAVVSGSQVVRHLLGVIEISDCRREMRLTRQEDVFGAAGQVSLILDRKSTRLNSSHSCASRMPSSA